jgi:hypothetical protein
MYGDMRDLSRNGDRDQARQLASQVLDRSYYQQGRARIGHSLLEDVKPMAHETMLVRLSG